MILTVNNRTLEVSQQVADSLKLPGNQPDELIVVLDRTSHEVRRWTQAAYRELGFPVKFTIIRGKPGWKGPATAWNRGFQHASIYSDVYYCISSEVVQDEGNIEKARKLMVGRNTVVFGACHNSVAKNLVVGAEPGLLVSSKMPRPLGFLCAIPAHSVHEIHGFDEAFMDGFWYDDDDFFLRLWQTGLNFRFDDSIHGIHLDHDRPDLETPEGLDGIERNRILMHKKHGTLHPWQALPKAEFKSPGLTVWRHP